VSPDRNAGGLVRGASTTRIAALGALGLVIVALIVLLLSGGKSGYTYTLLFENGGQLVGGNEVKIGGVPVGKVDSVELTEDSQAEITITTEEPIPQGTSAVIRATSLSGIANRYITLNQPSGNQPDLEDGSTITQVATTSPVDIDQLFNTFTPEARKGLQDLIQGSASWYAGNGKLKNKAVKYFAPSLVQTDELFKQVGGDQAVLTNFLLNGSKATAAIAARRDDLADAVSSSNEALGAVASENASLDQGLRYLAPTLRQANTTFVNLRSTLTDLEPFIEATADITPENLTPFLKKLKGVAGQGVPVFKNLRYAVNRPKNGYDLADFTGGLVDLQQAASTSFPATIDGMQCSAIDQNVPECGNESTMPFFEFARPYTPDLTGLLAGLSQVAGYYDADGHFVRASPVTLTFNYLAGSLVPNAPSEKYGQMAYGIFARCPGGGTQVAADSSNPFLAGGQLTANECDSSQMPPGPP
jgi:phospholipid/cholesterol/gamma-HCH transport system substrate-binding protein